MEYVCGFLFSEDESKVALIVKQKPAWQAGRMNGIGGKLEVGETHFEAMSREFLEETGVSIFPEQWNKFANVEGKDWVVFFMRAMSDKVYECRTMETEEIVVVNVYEIGTLNVIPNLKWLIPMALDPNHDMCMAHADTVRWKPVTK